MKLIDFLTQKRAAILEDWVQITFNTYPVDSVKLLSKKTDQFQNPIGSSITSGLAIFYDELLNELNVDNLAPSLETIIKIRSVQDFSASDAVSFIFSLKNVIKKNLQQEIKANSLYDEFLDFENRIDQLALWAFDNYMDCREKLNEIKIKQAKTGSIKLIDRLNRKFENDTSSNEHK